MARCRFAVLDIDRQLVRTRVRCGPIGHDGYGIRKMTIARTGKDRNHHSSALLEIRAKAHSKRERRKGRSAKGIAPRRGAILGDLLRRRNRANWGKRTYFEVTCGNQAVFIYQLSCRL